MFEAKRENSEAVDRLCKAFGSVPRGTTIAWESIEAVMGRRRDERGGRDIVRRWRKWMQRHKQVVMHAEPNVGLELLPHGKTVSARMSWRNRRARRQIHWAISEIRTVDPKSLTDHERNVYALRESRLREQRRAIKRAEREATMGDDTLSLHEQRRRAMNE